MPTFQRCPPEIAQMAKAITEKFESYEILRKSKVSVDFVFAFADLDPEIGHPLNDALSRNGVKVLGLCRKLPLKERAMGRADAEISLDGDWWRDAADEERSALLDHGRCNGCGREIHPSCDWCGECLCESDLL